MVLDDENLLDDANVNDELEFSMETVSVATGNDLLPKQPKKRRVYHFEDEITFKSYEDAHQYLKEQGYAYHNTLSTKNGTNSYFRCAVVPRSTGQWCASKKLIFTSDQKEEFVVKKAQLDHDHDEVMLLYAKKNRMSKEMRAEILNLIQKGLTLKPIIKAIKDIKSQSDRFDEENVPTNNQINHLIRKHKKATDLYVVDIGALKEWCSTHSAFPLEYDQPFVISHYTSKPGDENAWFQFAISTHRLLNNSLLSKTMCVDTTHKLNWQVRSNLFLIFFSFLRFCIENRFQ